MESVAGMEWNPWPGSSGICTDTALEDDFESFSARGSDANARDLKAIILRLMSQESSFFLNKPTNAETVTKPKTDPYQKNLGVRVADNFIEDQLIEAVIVVKSHSAIINISELKKPHRECLTKIYFPRYKLLPASLHLHLPMYDNAEKAKRIVMDRNVWEAHRNPHVDDITVILNDWVEDFNAALIEAERQKQEDQRTAE